MPENLLIMINLIIINNVNIFTIYESLLKSVLKILPTVYQNKAQVPGQSSELTLQL